ncbi:MAG TPA: alpha-amylase family glycosyl hydrolase [Pseudomonadales bacterium]|nr:alpha-amylase family glycosyl hydrolase [Pseudomonadales bacterium]
MNYADQYDIQLRDCMASRRQDWRMGAVVYQVLVDRFAPSANLDAKRDLYPAPKTLHSWDEQPRMGHYLDNEQLWSHEIQFWGGDLASLRSKLHHLQTLNVDVLYLNPIHVGYTNHKYDSLDFAEVSPEFGRRDDVLQLADACHQLGMKLVLDGVFNHMGQNARIFKAAQSDMNSPYRDWFYFGDQYQGGYLAWEDARNLPELNLESEEVQQYIYASQESVVQKYLREGVDGWRLDVAHDIGYRFLKDITEAAHHAKADSLVVGEAWCYPSQWVSAMDGLMNFSLRQIVLTLSRGELDPRVAREMLDDMLNDSDYEGLLKSWLILDNHDTPRLANILPREADRKLAQVLHFTLPGSPNIYYGSEVGMRGGDDPEMRGPMRWDWVEAGNEELTWTKQLIALRQAHAALKIGNMRTMAAKQLFAFERYTEQVAESMFIVINPTDDTVQEMLMLRNAKLMTNRAMQYVLTNVRDKTELKVVAGSLQVTLPAKGFMVLRANTSATNGYTTFKRVV